jgi:hypothetical protein
VTRTWTDAEKLLLAPQLIFLRYHVFPAIPVTVSDDKVAPAISTHVVLFTELCHWYTSPPAIEDPVTLKLNGTDGLHKDVTLACAVPPAGVPEHDDEEVQENVMSGRVVAVPVLVVVPVPQRLPTPSAL